MTINIPTPQDLPQAARTFVNSMNGRNLFAFNAPMGAGKTTFISEVCKTLGMSDEASSPTFSIVNEYHAGNHPDAPFAKIFHFDFYRIETAEEALDLGLDDYFFSGFPCFMEWSENVRDFLPDNVVSVDIEVADDGSRSVIIPD